MIDFVFALIVAGMNASGDGGSETAQNTTRAATGQAAIAAAPTVDSPSVQMGQNVTQGAGVVIGGASLLEGTQAQAPAAVPEAPATPAFNMAVVPPGLVAEPQMPSGKFTTAAEVKPILSATQGNWVAVREFNGKDLLYVTHLWGWRCGLHAMAISVNDEPMQNWPLPPCHMKYTTPNAILEEDGLPYLSLRLGTVETIEIQIVYDDLSMERARFERGNVLIP